MAEETEVLWFMGPVNGPGFVLMRSESPGVATRKSGHRPPKFHWKTMDRQWHFSGMPQGYTAMNWRGLTGVQKNGTEYVRGWSVLSVTDYTQDKRPNVMVSFAVHRAKVQEPEMRDLAALHYPSIWARLKVREELWSPDELG